MTMGFLTYGLLCPSCFSLGILGPFACLGLPRPFFLTLYSHGLLLTSLGFPGPITSYSSLEFMGLPSIPYSLRLHCFEPAAARSYFFHIIHCPWVSYSPFLFFWALLSPFAFSRPIYLFYGPVIHYSYRLDLMVFVLYLLPTSFRSVLLGWASSFLFGFHKKKTLNNVQVKKTGNIQEKYPSPLHSMHYTNLVGRINDRMTPEQYPHNLQHILPPPAKP